MDVGEFLDLADEYVKLGWAVQEQFRAVADDGDLEGQNINALGMIRDLVRRLEDADVDCASLAEDLDDYFSQIREALPLSALERERGRS